MAPFSQKHIFLGAGFAVGRHDHGWRACTFAQGIALLILLALILIYVMQIVRIALRKRVSGKPWQFAAAYAGLLVIGKFAEASGLLQYWLAKLLNRKEKLIEYK